MDLLVKMWLLKKSNKEFNSQQGILNHISGIYKDSNIPTLQAYLDDNDMKDVPKCKCGNNLSFISFFKGFKSTCNSLSCSNKESAKRAKLRYVEGYQEYILSNLDFYKSNMYNKCVIDPFTKESIGKLSYRMYILRRVKDKDFKKLPWNTITKCIYCDSDVYKSVFSNANATCKKQKCKLFNIPKNDSVELIYKKYLPFINRNNKTTSYINRITKMISDRENIKYTEISMLNNRFFGIPYKLSKNHIYNHEIRMFISAVGMREYVKSIGIDWNNFLKRNYYSQCYIQCLNCGIDVKTSDIPIVKNNNSKEYCSHACYHSFISTKVGRDKYGFDSESARKKRSDEMKTKISNGTFTPNVTNSWCRSKIQINIDGVEKSYRSSWEAVFGIINKTFLYESKRIKYVLYGESHSYIIDFEDTDNKILFEIKPDSLIGDYKVSVKREAAIKWCSENNYVYKTISNDWFINELAKPTSITLLSKYDKDLVLTNKVMKGIK